MLCNFCLKDNNTSESAALISCLNDSRFCLCFIRISHTMLFTSESQAFFYLLAFLLAMSRLPRGFVFSLLAHCSSCESVRVPNSCVYKSKKGFFFLIQHGWAERSGVAATLSALSDQLAQLLTPTFTHAENTHTHTLWEERSQHGSLTSAMERRTFAFSFSLSCLFLHLSRSSTSLPTCTRL